MKMGAKGYCMAIDIIQFVCIKQEKSMKYLYVIQERYPSCIQMGDIVYMVDNFSFMAKVHHLLLGNIFEQIGY